MKDYFNIINESYLKNIKINEDESNFNVASIRYLQDKKEIDDIINKQTYKYLNDKEIRILKNFTNSLINYDDEKNINYLKELINNLEKENIEKILSYCIKNKIGGIINVSNFNFNHKNFLFLNQGTNNILNTKFYDDENFIIKYKNIIKEILSLFINVDDNIINNIIKYEITLQKKRLTRAQKRNVKKNINKHNISDISFKNFNFQNFIKNILDDVAYDNNIIYVDQQIPSEYYNLFDEYLGEKNFKYYIYWCILLQISLLSKGKLYEKIFELVKIIKGVKKKMNKDKKIYRIINMFVGHIISKEYFIYIDPEIRPRLKKYINYIKIAFKDRLLNNKWMDDKTRERAIEKLENIRVDIFESELYDYNYMIDTTDIYYENLKIINEYIFKINMKNLLDNKEYFHGNIYNINAFYSPTLNKIIFPFGILKEPYFYNYPLTDFKAVAYNYGAIGSVIGHEIIHGFDDQGRLFDKDGKLNNWWEPESEKKYNELAEKLGELYKIHNVNTKLTMGENIADLGGLRISLSAYKLFLKDNNMELNDELLDHFTKGWAMIWRSKNTKEEASNRLLNDPHSPNKLRVNIPLNNLIELNKSGNIIEIW